VEFAWEKPLAIGAARIVSGFRSGDSISAPIADFSLQYHDGTAWRDIPGAAANGNPAAQWSATFAPVTAYRVRVQITRTEKDISRIWEIEFYGDVR